MAETKKKSNKKTVKPGKDLVESMVDEFRTKLIKIIDQDIKELEIDMKNVKDIDSTGLGALIAAKNSLDCADGRLSLINLPQNIASLFQILGLNIFFDLNAA